jgi:hypothetical protein
VTRASGSRALAFACLAIVATAASARAAEPSPGGPALRQARAAWDKGAVDVAEPLYREAIERGGLAPDEILEGYVRIGSARAVAFKKDQAIAAFRAASILDSSFEVPREAGPKGPAYANVAKRDTAKIGSLRISVQAPKEVPSGKSFRVTAQIDNAHLPIVKKVGLFAKDGTSGKEVTLESPTESSVEFDVPSEITMPNASLVVRVDALDAHANRLGSAEGRVKVGDAPPAEPVAAVAGVGAAGAAATFTPPPKDEEKRKGGGFWSTPWPYVIGGVALAGAGAAIYFGTRPSDSVAVGQVGVQSR